MNSWLLISDILAGAGTVGTLLDLFFKFKVKILPGSSGTPKTANGFLVWAMSSGCNPISVLYQLKNDYLYHDKSKSVSQTIEILILVPIFMILLFFVISEYPLSLFHPLGLTLVVAMFVIFLCTVITIEKNWSSYKSMIQYLESLEKHNREEIKFPEISERIKKYSVWKAVIIKSEAFLTGTIAGLSGILFVMLMEGTPFYAGMYDLCLYGMGVILFAFEVFMSLTANHVAGNTDDEVNRMFFFFYPTSVYLEVLVSSSSFQRTFSGILECLNRHQIILLRQDGLRSSLQLKDISVISFKEIENAFT